MAVLVIMPKLGQSVESCIIAEISKKKGDTVKKGDTLFSYETDKASFEEASPADGVVLECFFKEGDEVPVLDNVMIIGEPGEDYSGLMANAKTEETPASAPAPEPEKTATQPSVQPASVAAAPPVSSSSAQAVSPRAKNLAEKEALNASSLSGTGPQGRVIERDVKSALENRPKLTPLAKQLSREEGLQPEAAGSGLAGTVKASDLAAPVNAIYGTDYEDKKISNMRKIIAKSMHASLQNSAQLTHHLGADARRILDLRKQAKKALDEKRISVNITLNDMVCFAVIKALKK